MKRTRTTALLLVIALVGILAGNDFTYAQKSNDQKQAKQERRAQERDQNKAEKRERKAERKRDAGRDNTQQRDQNRGRDEADQDRGKGRDNAQQRERQSQRENRDRNQDRARQGQERRNNDQAHERARQEQQHRDNDRDRNYRDNQSPRGEREHWRDRDHWRQDHRRYNPPSRGYYPPRHGRDYQHRHYGRSYRWSVIILVAQIPDIFRDPSYRGCRYETRIVTNLEDNLGRVLIDGYPYRFRNGRDYLLPGQSGKVRFPVGHDLDGAVLVDGIWYEVELKRGAFGSDLVIPAPF